MGTYFMVRGCVCAQIVKCLIENMDPFVMNDGPHRVVQPQIVPGVLIDLMKIWLSNG